jgi:hypothetical protein
MIGYPGYFPKREISPATELACVIIAGILVIPAMAAYGIVKLTQWVKEKYDRRSAETRDI